MKRIDYYLVESWVDYELLENDLMREYGCAPMRCEEFDTIEPRLMSGLAELVVFESGKDKVLRLPVLSEYVFWAKNFAATTVELCSNCMKENAFDPWDGLYTKR